MGRWPGGRQWAKRLMAWRFSSGPPILPNLREQSIGYLRQLSPIGTSLPPIGRPKLVADISSLFVGGSLFLISCVSDRQAVDRHDEEKRLLGTERLVCRTLSVPGSEVGLRIPLSRDLGHCPPGPPTPGVRVGRRSPHVSCVIPCISTLPATAFSKWSGSMSGYFWSGKTHGRSPSDIPSANRSPHGLSSCRFSPYWRLYASVGAGSDT